MLCPWAAGFKSRVGGRDGLVRTLPDRTASGRRRGGGAAVGRADAGGLAIATVYAVAGFSAVSGANTAAAAVFATVRAIQDESTAIHASGGEPGQADPCQCLGDRGQGGVLAVVQVIGLGRGKQDPLHPPPAKDAREPPVPPVPERAQHLGHRAAQFLHRLADRFGGPPLVAHLDLATMVRAA